MNSVSKSIEPNKKNYQSQYPYKVKGNLAIKLQTHDFKFLPTNKAKTIRYCNIVIMKTFTSRICQKKVGVLTHNMVYGNNSVYYKGESACSALSTQGGT